MKIRILKIVFAVFLCVFIVSAGMAVHTLADSYAEQRTFVALAKEVGLDSDSLSMKTAAASSNAAGEAPAAEADAAEIASITDSLNKLSEINPDLKAWINIPGTTINYPVMKRDDDPEYYLHRDFYGSETNCGVPFLGGNCSTESMNILIYGHHMKNGSMFTDLTNFEDPAYREAHPIINLYTPGAVTQYEVIAAFREDFTGDEGTFYYYAYAGDLTEGQFNAYIEGIRSAAIYDTGFSASYGDKFITLSTCDYFTGDARFVVVGKKIS